MGTNGIAQLKEPLFLPDNRPAQENMSLNAHVLYFFHTDDLFDIHTHQLVVFILHPQPQRPYFTGGAVHGDHIHGFVLLLHRFLPPRSFVLL